MLRALPPLLPTLLLLTGLARADVGATLSVQTDARERGLSYSDNRPGAQLGLAWDGEAGWYAGTSLAWARFARHDTAALRAYGGRVVALRPGLNAEVGLLAYRFASVSSYDFVEAYAALLGERWNLRLFASPDYYGIGQRSVYGELNLRWPLAERAAAVAHVGWLRSWGGGQPGARRLDARAGVSLQLGEGSELQLMRVAAGRGGPYIWLQATRASATVLNLSTAF